VPLLTALPTTITAGDSVTLSLSYPAYPAPTWSGSLALAGPSTLSVTSTADGAAHQFVLTAVQTEALAAGAYTARVRLANGLTVETVERAPLTVAADVATFAPGENVSPWAGIKTEAEAALLAMMEGGGTQMVMINGRQVMYNAPDKLVALIAMCESRLAAERGQFGAPIRFDVVGLR
jgi:hypothetical protein